MPSSYPVICSSNTHIRFRYCTVVGWVYVFLIDGWRTGFRGGGWRAVFSFLAKLHFKKNHCTNAIDTETSHNPTIEHVAASVAVSRLPRHFGSKIATDESKPDWQRRPLFWCQRRCAINPLLVCVLYFNYLQAAQRILIAGGRWQFSRRKVLNRWQTFASRKIRFILMFRMGACPPNWSRFGCRKISCVTVALRTPRLVTSWSSCS